MESGSMRKSDGSCAAKVYGIALLAECHLCVYTCTGRLFATLWCRVVQPGPMHQSTCGCVHVLVCCENCNTLERSLWTGPCAVPTAETCERSSRWSADRGCRILVRWLILRSNQAEQSLLMLDERVHAWRMAWCLQHLAAVFYLPLFRCPAGAPLSGSILSRWSHWDEWHGHEQTTTVIEVSRSYASESQTFVVHAAVIMLLVTGYQPYKLNGHGMASNTRSGRHFNEVLHDARKQPRSNN
jgi:hypothetical protein